MLIMFKASFETRNFHFSAYGTTHSHAENALKRGLLQHAKDYGIDPDWWEEFACDIQIEQIMLNRAYRDYELIKKLEQE